jgi:hypothetical protein
MAIIYTMLFIAIAAGVMQATLDKAGVGRIEALTPSRGSVTLTLLSIPLTFLSNLGLIVVTIWSFFALPWLQTLGIVAAVYIVFSLAWSVFLTTLRRNEHRWYSVISIGIPLIFSLRLICAACVVFLVVSYVRGITL